MKPDHASKQSDADFQNDVREARRMADDGLIQITNEHPEKLSGHSHIDAIQFKLLK